MDQRIGVDHFDGAGRGQRRVGDRRRTASAASMTSIGRSRLPGVKQAVANRLAQELWAIRRELRVAVQHRFDQLLFVRQRVACCAVRWTGPKRSRRSRELPRHIHVNSAHFSLSRLEGVHRAQESNSLIKTCIDDTPLTTGRIRLHRAILPTHRAAKLRGSRRECVCGVGAASGAASQRVSAGWQNGDVVLNPAQKAATADKSHRAAVLDDHHAMDLHAAEKLEDQLGLARRARNGSRRAVMTVTSGRIPALGLAKTLHDVLFGNDAGQHAVGIRDRVRN